MSQNRLIIYFRKKPESDRFLPGDRYILPFIRSIIRPKKVSGIEKVFLNLCRGLDLIQVPYIVNLPYSQLEKTDRIVVLGLGKFALEGYDRWNIPIVTGIGLMTHPSEWPSLCRDFPVKKYLQHSAWTENIYIPYFGTDICDIWPVGIETEKWKPHSLKKDGFDVLLYNKVLWDREQNNEILVSPIKNQLTGRGLSYKEIIYGKYTEKQYFDLLNNCKAMIFLCEHESQGIACQEALSMNVPVLAWNQGCWLDPNRFKWGETNPVPASSVPYFDKRCGMKFKDYNDFLAGFDTFYKKAINNEFSPREFVTENLTLEKSTQKMMDIVESVYQTG